MPDWKTTLIKRPSLVLIVIGVLVFLIGAAGGLSLVGKFLLPAIDNYGRIALCSLGSILLIVGIILLVREQRHVNGIAELKTAARSYGIKIDSHRDGTQVRTDLVDITGSYRVKPEDGVILQLFTIKTDDSGFWPHPNTEIRFDNEKKQWYGTVSLGANGSGYSMFIAAALVTKSTQYLCNYYKQVGEMIGSPPPVNGSFEDYAVVCHKVLVERVI